MKNAVNMAAENWKAVNTEIRNVVIDGEETLRVMKGEAKLMRFDENTYARLTDCDFHNGTIEVKMMSRLLPNAPDFARGFIGIAYRISPDDSEFESFYIRPTNAMTDDPVRRSHGCQYFSYPGYTFAYFREYGITGYEAPIERGLDEWVALKAVIRDETAVFYLDGSDTPVLTVSDMKHGPNAHGSVGLFVDIGTEAFFKELIITQEKDT